MKRYPVAVLRERLAEALDAAYHGVPVVIERKGVRYWLTRAPASKKSRAARPRLFKIVDPAVAAGAWTWAWSPAGMTFAGRARAKTRK